MIHDATRHDPRIYTRASEARRLASGARRLPGGILDAETSAALDRLRECGYAESLIGCIARAIREAVQR